MKKILWSTAAAALFVLTLTGCADNAPVQTEDRPQTATEIPAESTAPVESEIVLFSADDELSVEDGTASGEPTASPELDTPAPTTTPAPQVAAPEETPASAPATSTPQETPSSVRATVTFEPSARKSAPETKAEESHSPAPSATPELESTPTPTPPAQSEPPAVSERSVQIYLLPNPVGAPGGGGPLHIFVAEILHVFHFTAVNGFPAHIVEDGQLDFRDGVVSGWA